MKRCLYCKGEVSDESVVDFCENCGHKVWGPKMLKAIIKNMREAKDKGNISQFTSTKHLKTLKIAYVIDC